MSTVSLKVRVFPSIALLLKTRSPSNCCCTVLSTGPVSGRISFTWYAISSRSFIRLFVASPGFHSDGFGRSMALHPRYLETDQVTDNTKDYHITFLNVRSTTA